MNYKTKIIECYEAYRQALKKSLAITEYLRKNLSGIAIPAFIIDTPNLGGKIPLTTKCVTETEDGKIVLC